MFSGIESSSKVSPGLVPSSASVGLVSACLGERFADVNVRKRHRFGGRHISLVDGILTTIRYLNDTVRSLLPLGLN